MDIQEAMQFSLEEDSILSESEIMSIKTRMRKNKLSESDWSYIKDLLHDKHIFTVRPMDASLLPRFSIEGVLHDQDVLMAFTNLNECEEYARRYAAVRIGRQYTFDTIPYESVIRIADAHEKDAYIDVRYGHEERFLVYSAKTKMFHLCINHKK